MRNAYRPMGRFFCRLMAMAALIQALQAGILAAPPADGPAMTTVSDTVYRADGVTAQGTVLISWPGFTTADGKAVAAGSLSVQLGSGGAFAASLAPNTGAQPAGVYYKVVYQLAKQEPSTEYWVVPATGSTTIGAVRAKLMPPTIAAQILTRDVAETNYVHVAGDQTLSGVKTFAASPSVPNPQNPGDAANKAYVDAASGTSLVSPGPIGSGTPNTGTFTTLAASAVQAKLYPWADITNPAYGAKGDAQLATNCATTNGSAALACTGGSFAAADVGKAVCASAAGAGGVAFCSTVAAYSSVTTVTMAANASNTASGQSVYWGTNNDAAIAAAIAAAEAAGVETIFIPTGRFLTVNGISILTPNIAIRFLGMCPKHGGRAGSGTVNLQCSTVINGNNNTDVFLFKETARSGIDGLALEGFGTGALVHYGFIKYGNALAQVVNSSGIGKDNFFRLDGTCAHVSIQDFSATAQNSDAIQFNGIAAHGCNDIRIERGWINGVNANGINFNPGAGYVSSVAVRDTQIDTLANGNGIVGNISANGVLENLDLESITGAGKYAINLGGYAIQFNSNFYYNNTRNLVLNVCYTCSVQNQYISAGAATDQGQIAQWINGGGNNTVYPPATTMPLPMSDSNTTDLIFDSYGQVRAPSILGPNGNQATAGFLRLSSGDIINWRNNANSANLAFGKDTSDRLTYNGNWFLDSSNNANVQNLTVNGTCTGCGSGGGGDLSSPPAIGSVAPNAGTFTTLVSQVGNGIPNAARFGGVDPCAKINAAIGSLDTTVGGTVEARSFTATDLATACTTTLTIDRPVRLLLPAGVIKLGANPGIRITSAAGVVIEGQGWEYSYTPSGTQGTILRSTGGYPLIADARSQGTVVRNVELDGNSIGTAGYLGPMTGGMEFRDSHIHHFVHMGIFITGGVNDFRNLLINNNGGDGMVISSDSVVEGNMQIANNGGTGLHLLSGGDRVTDTDSDHNGLHNLWADGNPVLDWTASTQIIAPRVYKPSAGNPGGYYFFPGNVGGRTGSSAPTWCQTQGCTVSDGTVKWYNVNVVGGASMSFAANHFFTNLYLDDAGTQTVASYPSFQASNLRMDGLQNDQSYRCVNSHLTAIYVSQAQVLNANADGIHLKGCDHINASGMYVQGQGYDPSVLYPDKGGLILEEVKWSNFDNYFGEFNQRSSLQLLSNTQSNQFSNIYLFSGSSNTTPSPDNHALYTDGASWANQINGLTIYSRNTNSLGIYSNTSSGNYIDNYMPQGTGAGTPGFDTLLYSVLTNAHGRTPGVVSEYDVGTTQALTIDSGARVSVGGDLSMRDIPGHEYFVSKYASIQAAIDTAYNNGTVQGGAMVIDDRTSPYSGAGFIVKDSVTLKLAATTYTITGTVTHNNGVSNVTAGIISMPGSHIVGAGTSANHGTNVNAGAGLNADLLATSTVGTGTGQNAQWWHWGSIENFHMNGNKAQQTAGSCINVENMGETAVLRALEVGNCYADGIRLEGNFATQSEITNITVNSAGKYGVNLDNFQGVGVLRGLSGDSNATSIIRFNGNQSATLTVLGLKSEEEISGHDPLITIDMPTDGSQPAFYLVGGYSYARAGVKDVVKIINGKTGAAPFVTVNNFYVDANFVNAVNDTVNSRTFAAANMNKVPFSYLPTGSYQSGQAFTFAPGTFIQGGSSALTEIFGSNTDGSSMIAAQGNGDGTSYYTGGLKIGIPNRTQFGLPPEMMARMGSRFLGSGQGYDTNTWVFVPIWKTGDSSNRWIGEPNQRWPEVYATDVNATTATVGTLNVTNCTGCGGGAAWGGITGTLSNQTDLQNALNGKQNTLGFAPLNAANNLSDVANLATAKSNLAVPAAASTTPVMNGTGAVGVSTNYARADHVHPSDTTRVATSTTVNGHALTGNVTVTASEVGAPHSITGAILGPTAATSGTGSMTALYSVTLPAGTFTVGTGLRCAARSRHTTGSAGVTMGWKLGSTTYTYPTSYSSGSTGGDASIEVFTFSSLTAETVNIPWASFGGTTQSPYTGLAWSENVNGAVTLQYVFNTAATDKLTGDGFYCMTIQ